MGHEPKFFAKLDRRLVRQVNCVAMVTIIKSQYGIHAETDVVMYRFRLTEHRPMGQENYEMVRFLPEDKEVALSFFPHGPPFLNSGSAWRETTGWLAPVVNLDVSPRDAGLVVVHNYPQRLPPHFVVRK